MNGRHQVIQFAWGRPSGRQRPGNTDVPNCARRSRTGTLGWCRPRQTVLRASERRRHADMKASTSELGHPIFIGRWTPKILFSLNERSYRHGQLRRHLGTVSQRMLTQNASQPRIHWIDRAARDGIEAHCRRVFAHPAGKDTHHSAQRYVPLGETTPQARHCRSAPAGFAAVSRHT